MRDQKIIFGGCARDCAPFLPAVLANLERLRGEFGECAQVFVENDSRDQTKALLAAYAQEKPRFVSLHLDGLAASAPQRTVRLAVARNTLIEFMRQWDVVQDYDYLCLFDLDNVSARALDVPALLRAIEWMRVRPQVSAIFPNQLGTYYDLWALRHPTLCPGDVWEEILDYKMAHPACDDQAAYDATFARRIFSLASDAPPLEVDSAFGGLGIYRLRDVLRNRNPYLGDKVKVLREGARVGVARWQQCEHVHFHAGLRQLGGRLYVMPHLINGETPGISFPPSAFRTMLF